MLKDRRKVLMVAGGVVGGVLLLLLLLPLAFRGRIEEALQEQVERRTGVQVGWDRVGLSFLRDFPHATLSVTELTAVGTGTFETDTLATLARVGVAVDIRSAIAAVRGTGALVVREVRLDRPVVRLRVLEDGTASWSAVRAAEQSASSPDEPGANGGLALELRSFELTDGALVLDDSRSGVYVSLEGLSHSLSGNFARNNLVARTRGHSDRATVRFAGLPYLNGVALDVDAELEVNGDESRIRFLDNELRLNALAIAFSGEVVQRGDALAVDLVVSAPSTEFAELLSLLPPIYASDFAALQTTGSFALDGYVRGDYLDGSLPAFGLRVTVDEGSFRYPDLPLAARAINLDLAAENPGGDADNTVVSLSRFSASIDDQPVEATLTLRTPISDPDVDLSVNGTVDLASLAQTVKMPALDGASGVIEADAAVRARRSDLDSARYDAVAAQGTIVARGVRLEGEQLRQPVVIEDATLELSPQRADLRSLRAQLGSSDVQASGSLDNLLGFAIGTQPLRGAASFTSGTFALDEWRSGRELTAIPVPARLDLTLDGFVERVTFGTLEMSNARGRALVADERLTLQGVTLDALGGRIGLDGWYETLDPAQPTVAFDVAMDSVDIPRTAAALQTVRAFAPVAAYARGAFSADLSMTGALGPDLGMLLDQLDANGSLATSRVTIEGFPVLQRVAEVVSMPQLASPTVDAVRSTIRVEDGRLFVEPFGTRVGGLAMTVTGSNGIDQSLDYTLGLRVPRSGLGDAAARRVQDLLGAAGAAGAVLPDSVGLGVRVTGTVSDPAVGLGLQDAAGSVGRAATAAATAAAGAEVQRRLEEAQERLDASRAEARQRAQAQADSLVAEAEQRAAQIRAEAGRAAAEIRAQGERGGEEVLARATNPLTRAAAQASADRIRSEANERATAVEQEADEQAEALVATARERADAIVAAAGG